jgi:uncharacterized lipoprotein YddW (UPF0748 family)
LKRLLTLTAALLALLGAGATQSQEAPSTLPTPASPPSVLRPRPAEVRGVWVVRTDLTTSANVSRVVRIAKANGLNTLYVQARGRGDAYYAGGLEPRGESLAKAAPDFDPLQQIIDHGHAAGLQVHAWLNACYVWSDPSPPKSPAHLVRTHLEWLAVDKAGRRCRIGDKEVFICPGNLEARAHLVAVCKDLATRYDLDGLQLDYIRYPNQGFCYCAGCMERFEDELQPKITPMRFAQVKALGPRGAAISFPYSFGQFRRNQVTSLVQEIAAAVKQARPTLALSAATITWGSFPGDFKKSEAYNLVAQDWFGWMRVRLIDAVCPMTYQTSQPAYNAWVRGVQRGNPTFPVNFGIAAYLLPAESAAAKVEAVRNAGGKGWVLFSYTSVTKSGADDSYLRKLKSRVLGAATASGKKTP